MVNVFFPWINWCSHQSWRKLKVEKLPIQKKWPHKHRLMGLQWPAPQLCRHHPLSSNSHLLLCQVDGQEQLLMPAGKSDKMKYQFVSICFSSLYLQSIEERWPVRPSFVLLTGDSKLKIYWFMLCGFVADLLHKGYFFETFVLLCFSDYFLRRPFYNSPHLWSSQLPLPPQLRVLSRCPSQRMPRNDQISYSILQAIHNLYLLYLCCKSKVGKAKEEKSLNWKSLPTEIRDNNLFIIIIITVIALTQLIPTL